MGYDFHKGVGGLKLIYFYYFEGKTTDRASFISFKRKIACATFLD